MRPLGRISVQLAKYFDNTCDIHNEVNGSDIYGAPSHDLVVVARDVACRLIRGKEFKSGAVAMVGEQARMTEGYRVIMPIGTPIDVGYRVTVDGLEYRVIGMSRATGLYLDVVVTT